MKNKLYIFILATAVLVTGILAYPSKIEKEEIISLPKEVIEQSSNTADLNGTYNVRKIELDLERTVAVLGQIGDMSGPSASLVQMDRDNHKPIYVVIDSPGGSVLDGATFISTMQSVKSPVYTICIRLCASMGAMIHQYGTKRYALDRSIIMFHPASVGSQGDVDRIKSFITTLQRYTNKMETYVAKRQGITLEQYKAKASIEFWVDAEDGLKEHVVDEIVSLDFDPRKLIGIGKEQTPEEYKTDRFNKIVW